MKSLAIYCVNYNSNTELKHFLLSVSEATALVANEMSISVFVADNSDLPQPLSASDYPSFQYVHFATGGNLGYLGAVQKCMKEYSPHGFDYVIISNVDLLISTDCFARLLQLDLNNQVGWIAPQIYSTQEARDKNPKIMNRYTKRALQILNIMYRYPWLFKLYERTLYKRKQIASESYAEGTPIYAGHGSFMIFTRSFFDAIGPLDYPVFLFCEEIYLAELCRKHHLQVCYFPSIRVMDSEHCSTGKIHSKFYYRYNEEATHYILQTFYK